jgi:undecaprenyl diphosphate synthase
VDAVREISAKVAEGQVAVDAIDEELVARHLQTRGMTDPDLLVRTAGEMRVSNFLLWQISYAELWVTEKTWPEFDVSDFDQALIDYAGRERRFGGLNQGGKQTC